MTNAGHADLIEMKDGSWWAVFLASRPYTGFRYNTGRETFLLPVTWKDGWPIILEQGKPIPYAVKGPRAMARARAAAGQARHAWARTTGVRPGKRDNGSAARDEKSRAERRVLSKPEPSRGSFE